MRSKLSLALLSCIFLFSCKKDIRQEKIEAPSVPPETYTIETLGIDDYRLHIEDLFNGTHSVSILTVGPPRHIYKWQLLRDGFVVASANNVDWYNEASPPNPYEFVTTLANPLSGTYKLKVWFNGFYTGGGWTLFSPNGTEIVESDENIVQNSTTGNVSVYRYWNASGTDHFYSTIKTFLFDWAYETVEFTAKGSNAGGWIPVYRYWNASNPDHLYVTSMGSYSGYSFEKIEFYVYPSPSAGLRPLYKYWSLSGSDHFYTVTSGSYPNYVYEGILGYVM